MPRLSLLPVFLREIFGSRTLSREPESSMVMDEEEQVAAYAESGRIDGVMAAAFLFHAARISQVIQGCRWVIDLGCGPATQLAQVAELNPHISFLGIELSEEMLDSAKNHVHDLGLTNVEFMRDDITRLQRLPDQTADAVISTMTLHHLPSHEHLRACFQQINRILCPEGSLYLVDFGRLKSPKSVSFFVNMNRDRHPPLLSRDYELSMRAAFLFNDFRRLAAEELPLQARVYSTFKVPLLILIKSEDRPLPESLRQQVKEMRQKLPIRYRHDLDDLRFFFWLGGLWHDPFR